MTDVLDCTGQLCPLPVVALAKAVEALSVGESVRLVSDDPAARVDVPAWCRMRGHELSAVTHEGAATTFEVTRR